MSLKINLSTGFLDFVNEITNVIIMLIAKKSSIKSYFCLHSNLKT